MDLLPRFREKKSPVWITNPYSRQLVHKWRTEEQAILVTNTVLDDNPKLIHEIFRNNPIRIVLDKSGKISENYHVRIIPKTILLRKAKFHFN